MATQYEKEMQDLVDGLDGREEDVPHTNAVDRWWFWFWTIVLLGGPLLFTGCVMWYTERVEARRRKHRREW